MLSSLLGAFAASAYLHLTVASPLYLDPSIPSLDTRATYNCTDLRAEPSPVCWDELDIAGYLAGWNKTTPICQATGGPENDGSGCCAPNEPWSTCFLRLSYGAAGTDCTVIKDQSCILSSLSGSLDQSIAPKVAYVVRNIVVINNLISSYYTTQQNLQDRILGFNSELANLQPIVKTDTMVKVGDLAVAWHAALPFWGTSTVLAEGPQQIKPNVNSAAARAFAQSIQNTPAVSIILFGASTNTSTLQYSVDPELPAELASSQPRQTALGLALSLIMSDMPTFSAWAAHGLYSGSTGSMNIVGADGLTSSVDTLIAGQVLSQSRFSATPASTTVSKEAFQQGRTCTTLGDVCKDSDGKTYYWSQAYQTTYQINEPKNWASDLAENQLDEVSAYGLLKYIETMDAYMPVLFDGAYNCTLEGKAGGSAITLKADNSLDVACLSSLPIYLSKGSSCPSDAVQVGGKCPFGFNG